MGASDNTVDSIGISYLDVCDKTTGPSADYARKMAAGIRAIIANEKEAFKLECPCNFIKNQYWFLCKVSTFNYKGERFIVVCHDDITLQKLANDELRITAVAFNIKEALFVTHANSTIIK